MVTIELLLLSAGFYCFYKASFKNSEGIKTGVDLWLQKHVALSKATGGVLFALSIVIFIIYHGVVAGIMLWFIALMTLSSSIIILVPLNLITRKILALLFVACFLLELIVR